MDKLLDIFLTEQLALRLEREISNQMDELIGNKVKPISRKFSIASKDKKLVHDPRETRFKTKT